MTAKNALSDRANRPPREFEPLFRSAARTSPSRSFRNRKQPPYSILGRFQLLWVLFAWGERTLPGRKKQRSLYVQAEGGSSSVYRYNICNGLSNQLLYHAASIARALQQGQEVEIPDYFIVNGVQMDNENVLPNRRNSVPFGLVFDRDYFLDELEYLGVNARMVTFDFRKPQQIPCPGIGSLHSVDPYVVYTIIQAFQPSRHMQKLIANITSTMKKHGLEHGICLHHRDGQDWHDHCARWSSIQDGIYRGNCLGEPPFLESLKDRGLTGARWLYYCGDHEIPQDLLQSGLTVLSQRDLMSAEQRQAVEAIKDGQPIRDLWALIDFYACNNLKRFIGNSVSTFSAIQIALRDGDHAYWYNSQSIPLASLWRVYQLPLVYTYTELSMKSGKHMLQTSITSVRQHMPHNKIHILYNGNDDKAFRQWLTQRNVTIHDHYPTWRGQIEEMRKHGDPAASHLFAHSGNYLGTWQRIDIPLMVDTEYVLLLDSDTVVTRPFTLADFGLDLTHGLAMSSEFHYNDKVPSNAGVTLMNIPYMRRTYDDFLKFILKHVDTAKFNHPSPSDQGAYLDFYKAKTRFMSRDFNFKPYWPVAEKDIPNPYIVHFHGAKPHDYLKAIMGNDCDQAIDNLLCKPVTTFPFLCRSLQTFATASSAGARSAYCEASFQLEAEKLFCTNILDTVSATRDSCSDFSSLLQRSFELVSDPLKLDLKTKLIEKNIKGFRRRRKFGRLIEVWLAGWALLFVALYAGRRKLLVVVAASVLWCMLTVILFSYHLIPA